MINNKKTQNYLSFFIYSLFAKLYEFNEKLAKND